MSEIDLETNCIGLESNKILERKKCAETLLELINNPTIIKILNASDNKRRNWDSVVNSVQKCLRKEGEKFYQDDIKQKTSTNIIRVKNICHNLLLAAVRKGNSGGIRLSCSKLMEGVQLCFSTTYLKKYFSDTYVTILVDHILPVRSYWGEISPNKWIETFELLKHLYENHTNEISQESIVKGLYLTVKWGSLHSSLNLKFSREYKFVQSICMNLKSGMKSSQQKVTLQFLLAFCIQLSRECRMASCKLGEDLINSLTNIYQPRIEEFGGKKSLIFDFLLLQVRLHHPGGVTEGNDSAYAFSWIQWKSQIRSLYSVLSNEVDVILRDNSTKSLRTIPTLWPNFLALIVEVSKQVLYSGVLDVTQASVLENFSDSCSFPVSKKPRLEVGFPAIISVIQSSGCWPWLCIVRELLKCYPDSIQPNEFATLLEVLANLQAECKDLTTRHYLYHLLSTMVESQEYLVVEFLDVEKTEVLWARIWDTSLRAVGLNQNEETTHKLLQSMLQNKKSCQPLALLQIYVSGVLNLSVYSIQTLNILCQSITIPEIISNGSEIITRKYLLNWVFALNHEKLLNSSVYVEQETAQVLSGLLLKTWPYQSKEKVTKEELNREYKSIEDTYNMTSFEGGIITYKTKNKEMVNQENVYLINADHFAELNESLNKFVTRLCEYACTNTTEIIDFVNGIILILHVLSEMWKYEVLNDDNLTEFVNLARLLNRLNDVVSECLSTGKGDIQLLKQVELLFSVKLEEPVSIMFRRMVPVNFLKIFFDLLNTDEVDNGDDFEEPSSSNLESSDISCSLLSENSLKGIEKMQFHASRVLSRYCCVPNDNSMSQRQLQVLTTLADPNFDPLHNLEFQMSVYFLQSLTSCKQGTLSDATVLCILESLQNLMESWHSNHDTAILLLGILKDSLQHVSSTNSDQLKKNSLVFLSKLYERRERYGPSLSISVLNCMGELTKLDPLGIWPGSDEIVLQITKCLKSNYHEVRLNAIKNLLYTFTINNDHPIQALERQKRVFEDICQKILESFSVSDNLTAEQTIDESVNRTASALHAYAALIVISPLWRKRALFSMIQLVSEKKLNIDLVGKVLSIIGKSLNMKDVKNFMDINLNYLISQWYTRHNNLTNFPFALFECQTDMIFFSRYINIVVPTIMQDDNNVLLTNLSQNVNKTMNRVIEDSFPRILGQFLPAVTSSELFSNDDVYKSKRVLKRLGEVFTADGVIRLMIEKLDEVYIHLLDRFYDSEHFENQFGFSQTLPDPDPPFYNNAIFMGSLKYIENNLPTPQSIIAYCIKQCPYILEHILQAVTMKLYEIPTYEEQLISLHKYTFLVDYIIPQLQVKNDMNKFLLRSITYTLINLIKHHSEDKILLSIAACRYFKKFVSKCLSYCSDIFEKLLVLITSTLVPIAKQNSKLSDECISFLNFLIADNSKYLYNGIGMLDPFPNNEKFENIQTVYKRIKYGNDTFTLEQEIRHFLTAGDFKNVTDRAEGLQHLKSQLSNKKAELAELYAKLHELRGFCEDFEESILHQLICMLVKLTTSSHSKVSLEAARCLGELGPADLTTLVLKPEEKLMENESTPIEQVVGQVTVLLSQYLVDYDIRVSKAASDALYSILGSKEGKSVASLKNKDIDFGCGTLDRAYVIPFLSAKRMSDFKIRINEAEFCDNLDRFELWCPMTHCEHSEWITTLVCELLQIFPKQCFLSALIPMCQVKVEFAEQLFPLLIFLILCNNKKLYTSLISKQIEQFFANNWTGTMNASLSQSSRTFDSSVVFNRASVQCMLNVVHFIRLRVSASENKWSMGELSLNYLHVAQGAQFCSAYFTSILYAELWCYSRLENRPFDPQNPMSALDCISKHEPTELTQALENILREGYKKIGDLDAMNGCGTSYLLDINSRVEYYKQLGKWDQITLHYDLQLSQRSQDTSSTELVNSLKNCSLHYLASNFKSQDIDTQYECAWRLGKWDLHEKIPENEINNYEKYHYFALKSFHEMDNISMNQAITQARTCVIQSLSHASLESSKNLYSALTELQALQEIENLAQAKSESKLSDLLEKWKIVDGLNKNEFKYIEPIKAQRITMLNDIFRNGELVKPFLAEMLLQVAGEARIEGRYDVAQRSLHSLSYIEDLSPDIKGRRLLEQAQMSWLHDKTSGRYLLRHLLDISDTITPQLHAMALKLYGNWMVETHSENPSAIIEKYFSKSLQILDGSENSKENIENRCEVRDSLARFADAQYQQVSSYIESPIFETKIQTIHRFRALGAKIRLQPGIKTQDEKRAVALYERQSQIDEAEIENARNEKNLYLTLAITQYLRILEQSDSYNLKIFRILSLCLGNKSHKEVLQILKQTLNKVPSYKFIPLLPQLVPHIGGNPNEEQFEEQIHNLLERCAIDHPHHTLPIIMALADSYKDREYDKSYNAESAETRVQSAKDLLAKLKKKKPLMIIIQQMELLSDALISLAYLDANKLSEKNQQYTLPRSEKIKSIKNLDSVLLPTITMAVRKSCRYEHIIGIKEFGNTFRGVGGVNAPKKISCTGTDGIERSTLIKGKDDLRQDAVMQQVFTIMNTLLAKNKQTNKLLIRTYKVVPLSQRSGIIEWCEGTVPLGNYLTEAHKRYHPSDLLPNKARLELREIHGKNNDIKYRKYINICSKMRPVFHMFFISSYPQPTIWFERRRAYMHSVATSSMIGYILGLGDRHVANILLDKNTAEVIHIDFGIAFEQGLVLPTPETVPFRLTRDIEAGMGVCGIEGVFRRSCEKTMHVLRQNAETVLTILEVLLYDPLYAWTITAAEAYSRQRDDEEENIEFSEEDAAPVNKTAERALWRLKQKLQGTENGAVCSVEGQVELLLQKARDPVNLSRVYHGWQPYF